MNAAEITALCTGLPAVLAALTGLVVAIKAHSNSTATKAVVQAHLQANPNESLTTAVSAISSLLNALKQPAGAPRGD